MSADINTYYSPPEQIAQIRQMLAGIMGDYKPTPKQTSQIWKEAKELLAWMDGEWVKVQGGRVSKDEYCRTLEDLFYRFGNLRLFWGLSTDDAKLGHFLEEAHIKADRAEQAGAPVTAAITRASNRGQEEWQILAIAANDLSYQAGLIQSQRLEDAANALRAMLVPERIEPEAPAKAAQQATGKKGQLVKNERLMKTKNAMIALYKKGYVEGENGARITFDSPNHAAELLKGQALELAKKNKHPLSERRIVLTLGDWFRAYDKA